jgi:hypothetical protein
MWRQWRELYAKRFRALEAVLQYDEADMAPLVKGVLRMITSIGKFYHLQYDEGLVDSAMYYSDATMKFTHSLRQRETLVRTIRRIANPATFLRSLSGFDRVDVVLSNGEALVPTDVPVSDLHRAFTVQHLLEDMINEAWRAGERQPLRFSWNEARMSFELTLSKVSPLIRALSRDDEIERSMRAVDEQWWIESVEDGWQRVVIPTYRLQTLNGDFPLMSEWRDVMDKAWPLLLSTALPAGQLNRGELNRKAKERLKVEMRWIRETISAFSKKAGTWREMTIEREVVNQLAAKLNNLISLHVLFYDHFNQEELRMKFAPDLETDIVSPLRRVRGSLENLVPHLTITAHEDGPFAIPEDLEHAHRFFDAFVLNATHVAGPDSRIRLIFGWDEETGSVVIDNPDGHMARHVESIQKLPHLHSETSRAIVTNAAHIAPEGSGLSVNFSGAAPTILVPMRVASVG